MGRRAGPRAAEVRRRGDGPPARPVRRGRHGLRRRRRVCRASRRSRRRRPQEAGRERRQRRRGHLGEVRQKWYDTARTALTANVTDPITKSVKTDIPGQWKTSIGTWYTPSKAAYTSGVEAPIKTSIGTTIPGQWKTSIGTWYTPSKAAYTTGVENPVKTSVGTTIPGQWKTSIAGWFKTAEPTHKTQVETPLGTFYRSTLPNTVVTGFTGAMKQVGSITNKDIAAINAVTKVAGVGAVSTVKFAKGGTMPGYEPGKDTHAILVGGGEGILVPEAVVGIGGAGAIDALNYMFAGHRGAGKRSGRAFAAGGMPANLGTGLGPGLLEMTNLFGAPADPSHEAGVNFAGRGIQVNKLVGGTVGTIGNEIAKTSPGYVDSSTGGFRTAIGASSSNIPYSMHQFGLAIDVSPSSNPYLSKSGSILKHPDVINDFAHHGWYWGGHWSDGSVDQMHFQLQMPGGQQAGGNASGAGLAPDAIQEIVKAMPKEPFGKQMIARAGGAAKLSAAPAKTVADAVMNASGYAAYASGGTIPGAIDAVTLHRIKLITEKGVDTAEKASMAAVAAYGAAAPPGTVVNFPPGTTPGTLNTSQLIGLWQKHKGPGDAAHMAAIAGRESGGRPSAIQQGQPPGLTGWGLWQITPTSGITQGGKYGNLLNADNNADAAISLWNPSYSAWAATRALGGVVPMFDGGGWLPPGLSLTHNNTGKPEPVLSGAQWDTLSAAAPGGDGAGLPGRDMAKRLDRMIHLLEQAPGGPAAPWLKVSTALPAARSPGHTSGPADFSSR